MKHITTISRKPVKAQAEATLGSILTVVASILSVVAGALVTKEGGTS